MVFVLKELAVEGEWAHGQLLTGWHMLFRSRGRSRWCVTQECVSQPLPMYNLVSAISPWHFALWPSLILSLYSITASFCIFAYFPDHFHSGLFSHIYYHVCFRPRSVALLLWVTGSLEGLWVGHCRISTLAQVWKINRIGEMRWAGQSGWRMTSEQRVWCGDSGRRVWLQGI